MKTSSTSRDLAVALAALLVGCAGTDTATSDHAAGAASDDETSWVAPAEGSCEALAMLAAANSATEAELDGEAKLDRRAVDGILAARPFETLAELDEVAYVGGKALSALAAFAKDDMDACAHAPEDPPVPVSELGVVSDLDLTVVPEAKPDLADAPYPGVAALYQLLEHRNDGKAGDFHYVTARTPARVVEMPAYLERHGVPAGVIETGTSGMPWIAKPEKIKDIESILARTGDQKFVFFGDTSAADPEVYRAILAKYPDRVAAVVIHKVDATVKPGRVDGFILHESYAEAAAALYGAGVIDREEALGVMRSARDEGLELDDAALEALLARHDR